MKSCVMYTEKGLIIGNIAYERMRSNPEDVILLAKRYMGRSPKDEEVEIDNLHLPWQQPIDENGKLKFQVNERGQRRNFSPEEIASEILRKVRLDGIAHNFFTSRDKFLAEKALGIKGITKAVISVPAYFNARRIRATEGELIFFEFIKNPPKTLLESLA